MTSAVHQSERFAHALYGLIVITATLVAEQHHIDEPLDAIGILVGAAVVLFLIHLYIGVMAERAVTSERPRGAARTLLVVDNLPVMAAIAVPVAAFLLAHVGAITLSTAYVVSLVFSVAALMAAGAFQAWRTGMRGVSLIVSAVLAGGLGVLMIAVEAWFD